jgi:hypothetical protein
MTDSSSLSFVSGISEQPLLYRTVDGVLKAAVAAAPNRVALVVPCQSIRFTFTELDRGSHAGSLPAGSCRATVSAYGRRTASSGY